MAEVVNLRQAKKARQRAESRAAGDQNAARFGRTKAQKALEKARADKDRTHIDGHKREAE